MIVLVVISTGAAQCQSSSRVEELLRHARIDGQAGRFDQAAALYREILRLRPGWVPAEFDLALSYHFGAKYPEAIVWFNNVIRRDPSIANAYFFRGLDYYQLTQYRKAIASLQNVLRLHPENPEAHFYVAASFYQLSEFSSAALAYLEQIKIEPKQGDPYFQLIECYKRLEQTALHDLESDSEANYFVLLLEAENEIEQSDRAGAGTQLKAAIAVDSTSPEAWLMLARYSQIDDAETASAQIQRARENEKNTSPEFVGIVEAALNTTSGCKTASHLAKALCDASAGDFLDATRVVLSITRSHAHDARTLYWSVQVYRRLARSATATLALLSPDSPGLFRLQARSYEQQGLQDQAAQAYENALSVDAEDASTLIEYANFRSRYQEYEKAVPLLERAVALSPYDLQAEGLLGDAYLQSSQAERAIKCFANILKAQPDNEMVRLQTAQAFHTLDRPRDAIAVLQSAASDPDGRISYMLATFYARLGEVQNARRMMQLFEQRKKPDK